MDKDNKLILNDEQYDLFIQELVKPTAELPKLAELLNNSSYFDSNIKEI